MDGPYDYAALTILLLAIILNSALNGGVLLAFCTHRILQDRRFGILISLALADLLKIIPLILEIQTLFNIGNASVRFESCLIVSTVGLYLICVTILHLLLESINRLIAIARPLRYKDIFTIKTFISLMVLVWFLPAIGIILTHAVYKKPGDWMPSFRVLMFNCDSTHLAMLGAKNLSGLKSKLVSDGPEDREELLPISLSIETYSGVVTVIYFIIPLIMMLLCYSVIFKISLKHIRQIKNMERNMRRLYHRLSKSRDNQFFGSNAGISTTGSVSTTETVLSPVQFTESQISSNCENLFEREQISVSSSGGNSASAKSDDMILRDYSSVKEHSAEFFNSVNADNPTGAAKMKGSVVQNEPPSVRLMGDKNYCLQKSGKEEVNTANRKQSTVSFANISCNIRKNSINVKPKRKRSNIIAPQDLNANNKDVDGQHIVGASLNNDRVDPRKTVSPIKAENVMSKGYEDLLENDIWYTNKVKGDFEEKTEDGDAQVGGFPQSYSREKISIPLTLDADVYEIESIGDYFDKHDEVFDADYLNDPKMNSRKINFQNHSRDSFDEKSEKKRGLWPKLWQKVSLSKDNSKDGIPSEASFLKIIEDLERKSKPSPKTFQTSARRVMRFSVLISSHQRQKIEEDYGLDMRPTRDEVDQLETLISYAERGSISKRTNEHVDTRVLETTTTSNDAISLDLFGVMTGFPVLEAWAQSLKEKSETPTPSNSFVRFYRVIRGEMRNRKQEGKLVKTLGGLFLAWIIFYVPILTFTWQRLNNWPVGAGKDFGLGRLLISWALLSSALNPIIYCLRIPEFKKAFVKMKKAVKEYFVCRS
eukprot:gene10605-19344_t